MYDIKASVSCGAILRGNGFRTGIEADDTLIKTKLDKFEFAQNIISAINLEE